MSGIYIPGMEMPASCGFCPFENHTDDGYECRINGCLTEYQKRPDGCPLVPVPDHGRLIDADAVRTQIDKDRPGRAYKDAWTLTVIDHAPTIIPAEEGE